MDIQYLNYPVARDEPFIRDRYNGGSDGDNDNDDGDDGDEGLS